MAVLARRKDTRQSIERARAAKAETAAKIAKLVDIRREALLTDESSDAEIVKLDREIATLKEAERVQGDRVAALEAQAAHEAAELRAHERQELIKRVEAKLAERDKIGAELQEKLSESVKLYRSLIQVSEAAAAGWNFNFQEQRISLLSDALIKKAVEHELNAVGRMPFRGGGAGERMSASFPGGKHYFELSGSLSEMLKGASAYASGIMRGKPLPESPAASDTVPFVEVRPSGPPRSAAEIQAGIKKVTLSL